MSDVASLAVDFDSCSLGADSTPQPRTVEASASPVTGGCGPTSRFSIYQRHESHRQKPDSIRALGRTRTCDQEIRRLLLYPLSYEGDSTKLSEVPRNRAGLLQITFKNGIPRRAWPFPNGPQLHGCAQTAANHDQGEAANDEKSESNSCHAGEVGACVCECRP